MTFTCTLCWENPQQYISTYTYILFYWYHVEYSENIKPYNTWSKCCHTITFRTLYSAEYWESLQPPNVLDHK